MIARAPVGADASSVTARDAASWMPLAVVCSGMVLTALDTTLLNLALPAIGRAFGVDAAGLAWVVVAYILTFAAFMLVGGSIGDRFGRRPVFLAGVAGFGLASIAAAFAPSILWLVAARAAMGMACAVVFPTALGLLKEVYADAGRRAVAIGVWSASQGVSLVLGPLAGGWLTQHHGWPAVFWLNVPLCAVAVLAGPWVLPPGRPASARLDVGGALLSAATLATLVMAILRAPASGWTTPATLAWFAAAGAVLLLFATWERRHPEPMLDLTLLRNRRFVGVCLAISALFFALYGFLFLATQYLQDVLALPPAEAGATIAPFAVGLVPAALAAGRLVPRIGAGRLVVAGLLVMAAGLAAASRLGSAPSTAVLVGVVTLVGIGFGCCSVAGTVVALAVVQPERAGIGAAMNEAAQQVGGTLGVAVLGSVAATVYGARLDRAGDLGLAAQQVAQARASLGRALELAADGGPLGESLRAAARHAFLDGYETGALLATATLVLGAATAARLLRRSPDIGGV